MVSPSGLVSTREHNKLVLLIAIPMLTKEGCVARQKRLWDAVPADVEWLLIADPLGAGLKADYKDATGKDLTSPGQLMLTGIVYRAVPGAQPAVLDQCGRHRCVRLLPKIPNGSWIDSRSFVIDLSARKVGRLG